MNERVVSIGAKMYECRRAARGFLGEKFAETMAGYGKTIRHVATERKIDVLPAAIAMAKEMQALNHDPIITICLMAAAVEIVEPTPHTSTEQS